MANQSSFFTSPEHGRSVSPWAVLLPLFAFLLWFYLPVTGGDFVADDYVFLATSRMVDTPLSAFWQSHFYEPYYFRPIGVLSWWLLTRWFGLDYASHSLVNLLLHMANAALLLWLLRALALRSSAVIAGVALFALGPFALAATLWPSNRFDLLASAFLLMQAIAMLRALQGKVLAVPLAMLAALAACWSKELAYPVATVMALVALGATGVAWRRRAVLFMLLGVAIGAAFFMRHHVLTNAYALASADPVGQVVTGATAMVSAVPQLAGLIAGAERATWLGGGLLVALLLVLLWSRRDASGLNGMVVATLAIVLAAFVVQTPLAKNFALMLDGGPFGTITFARFYYAPWLVISVLVALLVARGRLGVLASITIVAVVVAAALTARPLADSFADWTKREVKPLSVLATRAVEAGAGGDSPCTFVFLGAQAAHPYFRMFSDVTVKARTTQPEKVWRCHVMTESTPWLFAFPANAVPAELPLRPITNPDGSVKADSTWSTIRYRYRLPPRDLAALPGARFFEWRAGEFVEVSTEVRAGARKVQSKDW